MNRKLSQKNKHRTMMLRNLVTSLILFEKITTTQAKAKEVKGIIDKVINLAKKNNLTARRRLLGYLLDKNSVKKIFEVLIPRYLNRTSGYTYLYRYKPRLGDGTTMIIIQLIPEVIKDEKKDINSKIDKRVSKK